VKAANQEISDAELRHLMALADSRSDVQLRATLAQRIPVKKAAFGECLSLLQEVQDKVGWMCEAFAEFAIEGL